MDKKKALFKYRRAVTGGSFLVDGFMEINSPFTCKELLSSEDYISGLIDHLKKAIQHNIYDVEIKDIVQLVPNKE